MTATLHKRIHDAVKTVLEDLELDQDGLVGGVESVTVLTAKNLAFPCVMVSIEGERDEVIGGTTLTRQKRYPVRVVLLSRGAELPTDEEKLLRWRDAMIVAFDQRKRNAAGLVLPGCPEVYATDVDTQVVIGEDLARQHGWVASGFLVKASATVTR